jgi:hypothetical protein
VLNTIKGEVILDVDKYWRKSGESAVFRVKILI